MRISAYMGVALVFMTCSLAASEELPRATQGKAELSKTEIVAFAVDKTLFPVPYEKASQILAQLGPFAVVRPMPDVVFLKSPRRASGVVKIRFVADAKGALKFQEAEFHFNHDADDQAAFDATYDLVKAKLGKDHRHLKIGGKAWAATWHLSRTMDLSLFQKDEPFPDEDTPVHHVILDVETRTHDDAAD